MVSLVLVREGAASTKVVCDMDLEVAYAVILPGPMVRFFGVSLLVAFVLGVLVVAGDGLVVLLVTARGGRRVFPVGVVPPGCFVGSVGLLLGLVVVAVCLASSWSSVFACFALADLALLVEFSRCFAGPSRFRGIFRVAGCPPGGENCGM